MDRPLTILLVDDDESVRRLVARVLRGRGYRVLEAESGDEAHLRFQQCGGAVHLLICDVLMPGESGTALAQRLAASKPDLRTLMMSGDPGLESAVEAERPGTAEFIGKPFTPSQLLDNVQELLGE